MYTVNVCSCKVLESLAQLLQDNKPRKENYSLERQKNREMIRMKVNKVEKEGGCARGERRRGWDGAQGPGVISVSALPLGTSSLRLREHSRHAYWLLLPRSHSFCLSFCFSSLIYLSFTYFLFSLVLSFMHSFCSLLHVTVKWDKIWALHHLIMRLCTSA